MQQPVRIQFTARAMAQLLEEGELHPVVRIAADQKVLQVLSDIEAPADSDTVTGLQTAGIRVHAAAESNVVDYAVRTPADEDDSIETNEVATQISFEYFRQNIRKMV